MCLSERERKLLAYHYGLGNNEIKSLPEVAAYFTLTEKYIRTIEKKALAKLKDIEYSVPIVHPFRNFRAPISGKAEQPLRKISAGLQSHFRSIR